MKMNMKIQTPLGDISKATKLLLLFLLILFLLPLGCKQKEESQTKVKEEKTVQTKEAIEQKSPALVTKEEAKTIQAEGVSTEKKLLATVNGRPIYEEDLRGISLEDVIVEEILYVAGLRRGLDKEVEKQVENYKKRLVVDTLKREIMSNLPKKEEVNDEEIENYYNENESNYTHLHVKELSVKVKNIAEEIHKRALKGEDFEKIASDYSDSDTKVILKEFILPTNYNNSFDKIEIGNVSNIIQGQRYFLVLKIIEVQKIPLSKAKQAIRHAISAKRRAQAVREFAEKAKKEYNIKVGILRDEK